MKLFETCGVVIRNFHESEAEQREELMDNYVKRYPLRSWNNLVHSLSAIGCQELAENVTLKYIQGECKP